MACESVYGQKRKYSSAFRFHDDRTNLYLGVREPGLAARVPRHNGAQALGRSCDNRASQTSFVFGAGVLPVPVLR